MCFVNSGVAIQYFDFKRGSPQGDIFSFVLCSEIMFFNKQQ